MLEWLSFSVSDIWIRELRPVISTVYQESVEMIQEAVCHNRGMCSSLT